MKITKVPSTLLVLLATIVVTSAAASGNNYGSEVSQYNDAYERYEEGGYNEDSQDVSLVEDDMFREYIVHEERFCQLDSSYLLSIVPKGLQMVQFEWPRH